MTDSSQVPRIVIYASGNPGATFLTAGLLHGQSTTFGATAIQGTGEATPAPEVAHVLAELGIDLREWLPPVLGTPQAPPAEIGLTICVPT